jgi:drug/metabolite transporter (DMT)-like permease
MNALKEVSAPVAAIIYSAEPLWGAGLAWGILGERCAHDLLQELINL